MRVPKSSHRLITRPLHLFMLIVIGLVFLLPTLAHAATKVIKFAPDNTEITFDVRLLGIKPLTGEFHQVSGQMVFDYSDITQSSIQVSIKSDSVTSNRRFIENKIRSAEFLDTESYPVISFMSDRVIRLNNQQIEISGPLTLHGVTRSIRLTAYIPFEKSPPIVGMDLTGTAQFKRSDFGMKESLPFVSDQVNLTIKVRN